MKKNRYQTYINVDDGYYLHYNAFSNKYILLDEKKHSIYQNCSTDEIKSIDGKLFDTLVNECFIVENDFDEPSIVEYRKLSEKMDSSTYHIVINVTLDCNLRCWYCYENRIVGSNLQDDVLLFIQKNIRTHYKSAPYSTLKISFFGGEPFMNSRAIKETLSSAKEFCNECGITLIADFTTNATLIRQSDISFLQDYLCFFQITLDGNQENHNRIKQIKGKNAYELTLNNIHRLSRNLSDCRIWVRINYDAQTLTKISDILDSLMNIDKNRTFLILRKVWQTNPITIPRELLLTAIQKIISAGFFVDCYALSRNSVCFAERTNQVLINFDGKIFKCSTISAFDEQHSMGKINYDTGKIEWDINKIAKIPLVLKNEKCQKCELYPACFGPCNKNLLKPGKRNCILDEMNMTMRDYIMYNFKLSLLYETFD